jgi:hypothetical protein
MLSLFLLAACSDPELPPCHHWTRQLDTECPCADHSKLLDGGNGTALQCRPDQVQEWGPTPREDGNVSAVCRCKEPAPTADGA